MLDIFFHIYADFQNTKINIFVFISNKILRRIFNCEYKRKLVVNLIKNSEKKKIKIFEYFIFCNFFLISFFLKFL